MFVFQPEWLSNNSFLFWNVGCLLGLSYLRCTAQTTISACMSRRDASLICSVPGACGWVHSHTTTQSDTHNNHCMPSLYICHRSYIEHLDQRADLHTTECTSTTHVVHIHVCTLVLTEMSHLPGLNSSERSNDTTGSTATPAPLTTW